MFSVDKYSYCFTFPPRELAGFLSLPPSLELGKVEVEGRRIELERLEREVQASISSLHV